jgi:hypothetical protein
MNSRYDARWRGSVVLVWALTLGAGATFSEETDRTKDGLIGPVRHMTTSTGGTTTVRTYDRAGVLLETVSRLAPPADDPDAPTQARRFIYVYNHKRQRVREMSQDQDGPPYLSRRYAYDAVGRRRAEAAYHMCGTFSSLHLFAYQPDGRLHEQLTYQFRSLGRRVYEYDGQGRPKTVLIYKNGLLEWTTQYRYDHQGRIGEQIEVMPDATFGNRTTYQYDERGRLIAEQFNNRLDPSLDATSTYEYDERGNWTKKTTLRIGALEKRSSMDTPSEVTERTIEYFK